MRPQVANSCGVIPPRLAEALTGTQHQRPESPTVTPPGMQVNTRYINTTKGTSQVKLKKKSNSSKMIVSTCRSVTHPMFAAPHVNGTKKLSTAGDAAFITLNIHSSCLKKTNQ